jgi:hypothetical protein
MMHLKVFSAGLAGITSPRDGGLRLQEGRGGKWGKIPTLTNFPILLSSLQKFALQSPCPEGRYGSEILKPHFLKAKEWGFVFFNERDSKIPWIIRVK